MTGTIPSLPTPPGSSTFLEVINFDQDDDMVGMGVAPKFIGVTWKFDREQGRSLPQPRVHSQGTFNASQAEASFCPRDKLFYLTKAKSSFGQVEFARLSEPEKVAFREARKKELDSLIKNGAVKVLSVEESLAFENQFPDHVISSKFVDRFKPKEISKDKLEHYKKLAIEQGHYEVCQLESDQTNPKSRLCVVGWQDPQIHEVERSAPTPLSTSLHSCLQLAAARKWACRVRDVKTAFLQALPTTRKTKIAVRQPKDEPLPGLDPRQLLLLMTEVYGLVSGPSWWRRTFVKLVTETLGYHLNAYDKCCMILSGNDKSESALSQGFTVLTVDDIAEGGSELHMQRMKQLEGLLTFGKISELQTPEGSTYAGRHLRQMEDFSFQSHMDEFIYTRLEPIKLGRKVLKKDAEKERLTESEKTQLRGLIASLNWVAREGRRDASAGASILASSFPQPSVADILAANDLVHLKTFPVRLHIHAIAESRLRNVLISDSAFDTSGKERSQHGWLLGFTDETLNKGASAPVSLMQWRSKRLRRKAASSLLCETISLSTASAALERQDAFFQSVRFAHFHPRSRQKLEDEELAVAGKATVVAAESEGFTDPGSILVVDAKSLYDAMNTEQSHGSDDRVALELAIIRESVTVVRGRVRWVPHNANPSDALTKVAGAHAEPMLKLLRTGRYAIQEEDDVLDQGKQSLNRMKISARQGNLNFLGLRNLSLERKPLMTFP